MSKTDTIIKDNIIFLDAPRHIRFSMRSVFKLEERFGGVAQALRALQSEEVQKEILSEFLFYMTSASKEVIEKQLNMRDIPEFLIIVADTIDAHLYKTDKQALNNENTSSSSGGYDWDELLFFAKRYLNMTEAEFWRSTPRKFFKLMDLHIKSIGGKSAFKKRGTRESRLNSLGL